VNFEILLSLAAIVVNIFGFLFVSRQIRVRALATRGETYYQSLWAVVRHPSPDHREILSPMSMSLSRKASHP